ncbi:NrsF family protein [Paracidovorax sp. MALMAid1276]|uniref:NrsF family protein n=1 Tax=Paracidovorax sp. MALMAid1276 TaxID=3411631 RepID=UPI003B9CDFD3
MNTDELIHLLAADQRPVQTVSIEQRFAMAGALGVAGAAALMLALFGLRTDLAATLAVPMFWGKLVFAAALAAAGLALLHRMARPGMPLGRSALWLAVPPLVLWALAVMALAQAPAADRVPLILGSTWRGCPFNIAALSVPAFAAGFWALRGAAPTRLAWAGAGAGLLAGALGALVYALHCPEMAAPFLAVWYVAGIAIPTAVGALLGPRLLRW